VRGRQQYLGVLDPRVDILVVDPAARLLVRRIVQLNLREEGVGLAAQLGGDGLAALA